MKKILAILLSLGLLIVGVGCGDPSSGKGKTDANLNDKATEEQLKEKEDNKKEGAPINPEDLKPEITILEPDSIGSVYMKATYTNETEYPITGYNLTILLKDENEKTYLGTYDTVMPGEISPSFESFGPKTRKKEDYEILKLEVTAKLENGNELHIDYDFKLGEAQWAEYE